MEENGLYLLCAIISVAWGCAEPSDSKVVIDITCHDCEVFIDATWASEAWFEPPQTSEPLVVELQQPVATDAMFHRYDPPLPPQEHWFTWDGLLAYLAGAALGLVLILFLWCCYKCCCGCGWADKEGGLLPSYNYDCDCERAEGFAPCDYDKLVIVVDNPLGGTAHLMCEGV